MKRQLTWASILPVLLAALPAAAAPKRHASHPSLAVFAKLAAAGSVGPMGLRLDSTRTLPVVVTVETGREDDAGRALAARGATEALAPVRVSGARSHLSVRLPAVSLDDLASVPGFLAATLDTPLATPPPLDVTTAKSGAAQLRDLTTAQGLPLTGQGITLCDIDTGVDVFHPMFFRSDGGAFDFIDRNGNGRLDPDVDAVDIGSGEHTVRALNGIVRSQGEVLFGSDDATYDPDLDYLYVDENENGLRDFGPGAGFTDDDPSFGEMFFVSDDVNRDGQLGVGEKLVGLKTSKVKSFRTGGKTYRRGVDLIEAPWVPFMQHGNGTASVLVGGQAGYRRLVGMAPDADLVMCNGYDSDSLQEGWFALTQLCKNEGAQVVLHEVAAMTGYSLDGSSPVEELIDQQTEEGIAHVNPAGNFATAGKQSKRPIAPQETVNVPFVLPAIGAKTVRLSLWIRDTTRPLALRIKRGNGAFKSVPLDGNLTTFDGSNLYGGREDSSRGTSRYDVVFYRGAALPSGTYELEVTDLSAALGGPAIDLLAFVNDDVSGWGQGVGFPDHVTEDHLIGWPGNADKAIPVAAFSGTGFAGGNVDTREYYSGRGFRIDGVKNLWVSGPADPIAGARFNGIALGYFIFSGTSGAAPHVAGTAALIREAFPNASGDDIKQKIREGAVADAHTGAVPNEDWGYGKVNAYRSIFGADPNVGAPPVVGPAEITVPVGPNEVALAIADVDSPVDTVRIDVDRDYDGTFEETLAGPVLAVSYADVGDRRVRLRAVDASGARSDAILLVHVTEAPANPSTSTTGGATSGDPSTSASGSGGASGDGADDDAPTDVAPAGGCAIGAARDTAGLPWLALGAMLFAGLRRRRR